MKNQESFYSIGRIHKVVSVLLGIICPILTIQGYFRLEMKGLLIGLVGTSIIGSCIVYMINYKGMNNFKKYGIVTILNSIIIGLFFINGFSLQYHYLVFLVMGIGALYFDEKLMIYLLGIVGMGFISIFLVNPILVIGEEGSIQILIILGSVVGVWVTLYLLTKWMRQVIAQLIEKEEAATQIIEHLKDVMKKIEASTASIDQNISGCKEDTTNILNTSHQMVIAMNDMSEAIQNQTIKIANVDEQMLNSYKEMNAINEIGKEIASKIIKNNERVEKSIEEVDAAKQGIQNIEEAVKEAELLMKALDISVEKVNKLLETINSIASKTNMLAINASIEAARAGEAGNGFKVVAHAIQKLATESSRIVEAIAEVNKEMFIRSSDVDQQIKNTLLEAQQSKKQMLEVNAQFVDIKKYSMESNELMFLQIRGVQELLSRCQYMKEDIEHINSIGQENTATIEEVEAIIQGADEHMTEIASRIGYIAHQSILLKEMKNAKGHWVMTFGIVKD